MLESQTDFMVGFVVPKFAFANPPEHFRCDFDPRTIMLKVLLFLDESP